MHMCVLMFSSCHTALVYIAYIQTSIIIGKQSEPSLGKWTESMVFPRMPCLVCLSI